MSKMGQKTLNVDLYEVGHTGTLTPAEKQVSVPTLPANIYSIKQTMDGSLYFDPKEISFEKFIELPHMPTNNVLSDLEIFWKPETKEKYDKLGLLYKRGILMHGKPGVGKSAAIYKVCQKFVEQGGIVVYNPAPAALYLMTKSVHKIEPERRILAVFEEVEYQMDDPTFLSLLDGELQLTNIAYLATTNYIDQIPERIKNRPSRFARVIEVGFPSLVDRNTYLTHVLGDKVDAKLLNEVAELTDGFVLDQVKDVVVSHFVFDYTLEDSVNKIRDSWSEEELVEDEEDEAEDESEERRWR